MDSQNIQIYHIDEFYKGWFIGNFSPSIVKTEEFEIGYKTYLAGEVELEHFQLEAHELTLVINGECRLGLHRLSQGAIIMIPPKVSADFEAITDCAVVAIKWPSKPMDKVIGSSKNV